MFIGNKYFHRKYEDYEIPGYFKLTEDILIIPPLFGAPDAENELKSYMDETYPHEKAGPEMMEG